MNSYRGNKNAAEKINVTNIMGTSTHSGFSVSTRGNDIGVNQAKKNRRRSKVDKRTLKQINSRHASRDGSHDSSITDARNYRVPKDLIAIYGGDRSLIRSKDQTIAITNQG